MFCYQCEQTAQGKGCTVNGVCGKNGTTASLQDLLFTVAKSVSRCAKLAREAGSTTREADIFVMEALFTTVTNVNFDPASVASMVAQGAKVLEATKAAYENTCKAAGKDFLTVDVALPPPSDVESMAREGTGFEISKRIEAFGADVSGLQELIAYGLKGMAAYAHHAHVLGAESDDVFAFTHEALDFLAGDPIDIGQLVAMTLRVGEVNLKVMALLDQANTDAYGHPEPSQARITPVAGNCILISGHDLKDLRMLLEQTEGLGINVYTHSEMLPALAYPELKRFKHLVGNYGGAWQDQRQEFEAFPGAILMTTNCLQKPKDGYQARIFTTGLVAWPGVAHIEADQNGKKDFTLVIEAAKAAPGFTSDGEARSITIGFARNAVMNAAGAVVDAVKAGKIKHFFLIGGCDGAKPGRNYYTDLATAVPKDCVILTLACGKYRFNKLDFGDIGGIPRLLDCGQCNDAYSAVQIAVALSKAFECGVNDLPLSLILSWYEQKAVCILLSLLHLGIQDIRIGPSLPAFIGPTVLNVLVEKFGLKPISSPDADLKAILG